MKQAEDSTVIGKSVSIRGEFSASEDLYLDGEIQGTISLPGNRLTIGPNARVQAEVRVRDVIVFGRLEGNIHASGRVELRQSAVMQGDIIASRLSIEENASVKGRIEITGPAAAAPRHEPAVVVPQSAPAAPLFSEQKV
ncbi:MAG TPA: polymer-forming cytoskeletal protein [Granulicella sp.]|jgi:cytoskeletal protein CcmA (bactofilin family)|nr:polymer-forming cytoskeletal protein [Granulicella sp.]